MKFLFLLSFVAMMVLVPKCNAAVLDINYTVTDSAISDGNATGTIEDGTTQIGSWSVTNFSFTRLNLSIAWTPYIETIAANRADNSYGNAGVGIRMIGNAGSAYGVTSFGYTLSYSLTPTAISSGYSVDSVSFWGKFPNTVQNYGPAFSNGTGGNIKLSGFSGYGQVNDPTNNLQASDGLQFLSGTSLGGWNPNGGATEQDWPSSTVKWSLVVPDSSSLTYLVDYRDQTRSAANEATAFNLNIVPEPSALSLLVVGLGVVLRRRRRTV